MLIVMKSGGTREDVERVLRVAERYGCEARSIPMDARSAVSLSGYDRAPDPAVFEDLPGVARVTAESRPHGWPRPPSFPDGTRITLGSTTIGDGSLTLIAGPCAVEQEEQLVPLARALKEAGADLLRGGAYKPRTSPYDFQGLGEPGLRMLALAREETGLPVVTEAVDEASLELVEAYADVIQIGARNMQNYALLKRAGRSRLPVFLKRGMSAGLEDLLMAAEYVLNEGNPAVMLCERGIRTFSTHSRYTLDLSIVPLLKQRCHLPVFVDPSHSSGRRESVGPLARAAIAGGVDGLMVEVHPDPDRALCDGPQSLLPGEFVSLVRELRALEHFLAGKRETVL